MHWFIEQLGAVTAAENCCHTLHNTYTLRGARIRDPLAWSKYLDETIALWGDRRRGAVRHAPLARLGHGARRSRLSGRAATATATSTTRRSGWPTTGSRPSRSPSRSSCPGELGRHWAMRGYYGTVSHNVKATYVMYLGWFDGNPANLHVHPPEDRAAKYVEFMGGADAVLAKAAHGLRRGRLPLGGRGRQPRRLRRPRQRRCAGTAGGCAGAARLPGGVRPLAQLLPHRRRRSSGSGVAPLPAPFQREPSTSSAR